MDEIALFSPILTAIAAALGAGNHPPLYLVTNEGRWIARMPGGAAPPQGMTSAGPLDYYLPTLATNWRWDMPRSADNPHAPDPNGTIDCNLMPIAGRFWIILSGGAISSASPVAVARMVRPIVARMTPPGRVCKYVILDPDQKFHPTGDGPEYPDGTWVYWKNRTQPASYIGPQSPGRWWKES